MLADEGKLRWSHNAVTDARPLHQHALIGLGDNVPIGAVNCAAVNVVDALAMFEGWIRKKGFEKMHINNWRSSD